MLKIRRPNQLYLFRAIFAVLLLGFGVTFLHIYNGFSGVVMLFHRVPVTPSGVDRYIEELSREQEPLKAALKSEPRILCLILTTDNTIDTRARAVNATWARRCTMHFFVLQTKRLSSDIIRTPFVESRRALVHKVKFALSYIYEHYINDFDWLLKADDDTYIIMENLRHLLRKHNKTKPSYFGFHFKMFIASGYMSGGAGYVISNSALRQLVELVFYSGSCPVVPNKEDPENSEDIEIGRCLNKSGVSVISSLDDKGRETFHPYPLEKHLFGSVPRYVYNWARNKQRAGLNCCSKYSISFHYVEPEAMLLMDHLLYRTSVYGLEDA